VILLGIALWEGIQERIITVSQVEQIVKKITYILNSTERLENSFLNRQDIEQISNYLLLGLRAALKSNNSDYVKALLHGSYSKKFIDKVKYITTEHEEFKNISAEMKELTHHIKEYKAEALVDTPRSANSLFQNQSDIGTPIDKPSESLLSESKSPKL
jgi:hypothetical protein